MIWAYKFTREIARRMPLFRGDFAPMHPKFPVGSKAAVVESGMPVPLDAPDLEYSEEDENHSHFRL